MPRMAGIVIAGQAQHVVQRGDNRQDVFFVDDDRRAYLEFLRERCERFGFNAVGYCLIGQADTDNRWSAGTGRSAGATRRAGAAGCDGAAGCNGPAGAARNHQRLRIGVRVLLGACGTRIGGECLTRPHTCRMFRCAGDGLAARPPRR